ncbi:glycosyltransferase family 61 protein [Paeniglutamicibacter gangotriensis]|nr:glycosyltransferase 61 family protein [Paeniglutamicibacter gangotriensis]
MANVIGHRWPATEIIILRTSDKTEIRQVASNIWHATAESIREMHHILANRGKAQAIVDFTTDRSTFKNLFFHLNDGGHYILGNTESVIPGNRETAAHYLAATLRLNIASRNRNIGFFNDEIGISKSFKSISLHDDCWVVKKSGNHLYKIRDSDANYIFDGPRFGTDVSVLEVIEGGTFESEADLITNNVSLSKRFLRKIEYPSLSLRSYHSVVCGPGQVYWKDGVVLPDSFRQIKAHRLRSRTILEAGQWFAEDPGATAVCKEGTYFALDSEVPGHFGHFTSEIVARIWGWKLAKVRFPELKALISFDGKQGDLYNWQYEILAAAGVERKDVEIIHQPTLVERLIGATPMFSNPKFVHPNLKEVWNDIGRNLYCPMTKYDKIFVSRRPEIGRGCSNSDEVEDFFNSQGFKIIYPEDYSVSEQVSLFNNASTIAGYAGSGMFSLMFTLEPKKVIVIGSESYDAINEYLIGSLLKAKITYIWCKPKISHPEGTWTLEAFMSEYFVDLPANSKLLSDALA